MKHAQSVSKTFKTSRLVSRGLLLAGSVALASMMACIGGDTDGGSAEDNAGYGSQAVSDGGFGASLNIFLKDNAQTLQVAETTGFSVKALDPNGQPLAYQKIICDSEKGIAILEPSKDGLAIESTGADGAMSGVLGGLTPGSYLLECRMGQGKNLVARKTLKVEGSVPAGFTGFPGAAGGNLGGGRLVEPPDGLVRISAVTFTDVTGQTTEHGPLDILWTQACLSPTGTVTGDEPYGFDLVSVTITNGLKEDVQIKTVNFVVRDGRNVSTALQGTPIIIPAGGSGTFTAPYTEFVQGTSTKTFVASNQAVQYGTYNTEFTVRAESLSGENLSSTVSTSVTYANVDNCG